MRPLSLLSTVTGAWVAPTGTRTNRLVAVADNTCAATGPMYTTFFAATGLKPVPDRVSTVPTGPLPGNIPRTTGGDSDVEREGAGCSKRTETVFVSVMISIVADRAEGPGLAV